MPYMYFRVTKGLTAEQKTLMIKDITGTINKYIGAPPGMFLLPGGKGPVNMDIEYNIVDIVDGNLAKGGKLLTDGSVSAYIIINVMNSRPRKIKSAIVKEVTEAVARQLGITSGSQEIIVEIAECVEYNISHGGRLTYDSFPSGVVKK